MNRKAAEFIVNQSVDTNWQSPVEWPLIINKNKLKIGYQDARGLTFEDPTILKAEIEKHESFDKWLKQKYDSPKEWSKRLSASLEQVNTIKRFA